jgi:hypothetical protein
MMMITMMTSVELSMKQVKLTFNSQSSKTKIYLSKIESSDDGILGLRKLPTNVGTFLVEGAKVVEQDVGGTAATATQQQGKSTSPNTSRTSVC